MAGSNVCECPPPSEAIVECDLGDVASCYVDERGIAHTSCIPLSPRDHQNLNVADEMQKRQLMSLYLSGAYRIPVETILRGHWVSQTVEGSTVINIELSRRSRINARLPSIAVLSGSKAGFAYTEVDKQSEIASY